MIPTAPDIRPPEKSRLLKVFSSLFLVLLVLPSTPGGAEEKPPADPEQRLSVGDPVPVLEFIDVNEKPGSTAEYQDWIIVYSFADYQSNKPLLEWWSLA